MVSRFQVDAINPAKTNSERNTPLGTLTVVLSICMNSAAGLHFKTAMQWHLKSTTQWRTPPVLIIRTCSTILLERSNIQAESLVEVELFRSQGDYSLNACRDQILNKIYGWG